VLASVIHQVGNHLVQSLLISGEGDWLGRQIESPHMLWPQKLGIACCLKQQPGEVNASALKWASGVKPGQQQQVLNKARHPVSFGLHFGHGVAECVRVIRSTSRQFGVPMNRGEGSAQLVGGVSHKLAHLQFASVSGI